MSNLVSDFLSISVALVFEGLKEEDRVQPRFRGNYCYLLSISVSLLAPFISVSALPIIMDDIVRLVRCGSRGATLEVRLEKRLEKGERAPRCPEQFRIAAQQGLKGGEESEKSLSHTVRNRSKYIMLLQSQVFLHIWIQVVLCTMGSVWAGYSGSS